MRDICALEDDGFGRQLVKRGSVNLRSSVATDGIRPLLVRQEYEQVRLAHVCVTKSKPNGARTPPRQNGFADDWFSRRGRERSISATEIPEAALPQLAPADTTSTFVVPSNRRNLADG